MTRALGQIRLKLGSILTRIEDHLTKIGRKKENALRRLLDRRFSASILEQICVLLDRVLPRRSTADDREVQLALTQIQLQFGTGLWPQGEIAVA